MISTDGWLSLTNSFKLLVCFSSIHEINFFLVQSGSLVKNHTHAQRVMGSRIRSTWDCHQWTNRHVTERIGSNDDDDDLDNHDKYRQHPHHGYDHHSNDGPIRQSPSLFNGFQNSKTTLFDQSYSRRSNSRGFTSGCERLENISRHRFPSFKTTGRLCEPNEMDPGTDEQRQFPLKWSYFKRQPKVCSKRYINFAVCMSYRQS